jgi:hypothetical protein
MECNEELGNLVKTMDTNVILNIYIKARATPKVVTTFVEHMEFDLFHQLGIYCQLNLLLMSVRRAID